MIARFLKLFFFWFFLSFSGLTINGSGQSHAQNATQEKDANKAANKDEQSSASNEAANASQEDGTPWKICNQTSYSLRVATGNMKDEKIFSRGWTRVRSGSCQNMKIPANIPRLTYAESSSAHWGGIREWKGMISLCAADENFDADNSISCALQNMGTRGFMAVDPNDRVTTFIEPAHYGSRAATAGIQRLLKDNGYEITRIDGLSGRRTIRTLSQYLKDNSQPTNLSVEQQLDKLEQTALGKIKSIGLTICNNSSSKIWSAIGLRRKGHWESKGWWPIEKTKCIQPYTDTLIGAELHYYAQQEAFSEQESEVDQPAALPSDQEVNEPDKVLRPSGTNPSSFCIAESRFSALGRENCNENGYSTANFRVLPTDKTGTKIELTDENFIAADTPGLRR